MKGIIKAICISEKRGTQKKCVNKARLIEGWGIENDAHGGNWHRQVSLLSYDKINNFNRQGAEVNHGDFGENLIVQGIDFKTLPVGAKLTSGTCILEITQIGKECHNHCQIYHKMGDCIMPREGVFAKVLQGGIITEGDVMTVSNKLNAAVLTLSDKGAKGEREDKSGMVAAEMLENAGYKISEKIILPDEQKDIESTLINLCDTKKIDLIITTGGTGFSSRDTTPEATLAIAHKNAFGIAEAMRSHSLQITGRAMLGRGVSVIRGYTLIINLPGSPKAVKECLEYALPHIKHGVEILRGDAIECAHQPKH